MPNDLLYEIGVEEIPAGVVLPALDQLQEGLRDGLEKLRLAHGEIRVYGTPRRLTVIVEAVADRQPDQAQEYKGPPLDKAFDAEGKPTRAAEGFASKCGVPVEALEVLETDKGSWVVVHADEPGQLAAEVLPGLLVALTAGLSFPKTMRWADLDVRFARPVRWLVALLGESVLDLSFGGVTAGATSRGHRVLGSSEIAIAGASGYLEALRANYVLADHREREEAIRASAEAAAAEVGGRARIDDELLTETAFLVEWPACLWGRFDASYMELPEPVIVTVMQKHQRYFPVEDASGGLLPNFIAVRNGTDEGVEIVRAGNEKVIVPRLDDARFYLTEDLKHSLDERAASLARVTYMEGMGTLADKTARLEALVEYLAQAVPGMAEHATAVRRAACLSKADLVTLMVGDSKLGELQGVIGGEYATRQGEEPAAAQAIAEQYRPRGAGDAVPTSPAGTLLALADKLDNLASCFRLGAIPSGSTDPFALRRQAQGALEILLARDLHLDLPALVSRALELVPEPQMAKPKDAERVLSPADAAAELVRFFAGRVDYLLTRDGVPYDLTRAVLAAPWSDAVEAVARARHLQGLRDDSPGLFAALITAAERPARITRPEALPEDLCPEASALVEPREAELSAAIATASCALGAALAGVSPDYQAAVKALAGLAEPIHAFFADVMVMVDDEAVKRNRLALLREADRLFLRLADFLQVVQEGG